MVFETKIQVRYPDADSMCIVHHAVYPVYYEAARMDVFDKCGYGYSSAHGKGVDPALVHLELDYGAPVSFPGEVTVKTKIVTCEGKKLAFRYELFRNGDSEPCGKAYSFHVWVKDGKSFNLENEMPEAFNAYRSNMEV